MCCFTSDEPYFDSWFCVSLGIVGSLEMICLTLLKSPLGTSAIVVGVWCPKSFRCIIN